MATLNLRGTNPGLRINLDNSTEAPKLTRYSNPNDYGVQPTSNLYQGILNSQNTQVANAAVGKQVGGVSDRPTDTNAKGDLFSNFDLSAGRSAAADANAAARQAGSDSQSLSLNQASSLQGLAQRASDLKQMGATTVGGSGISRDLGTASYVADPNNGNLVPYQSVYDVFGRRLSDVARERSDQEKKIASMQQESISQQALARTQGQYQQNIAEAQKQAQIRAAELQAQSSKDVAGIGANAQIQSSLFSSINAGNSNGRYW